MSRYKKFYLEWKKEIFLLTIILTLGFSLRFLRIILGQQPIFADEAIYIRWAQVMKAEPTLRFLPLSDGKQPLYMWILMFILKKGVDPLVLGRLLSTFSGLATNIGIFLLSYFIFSNNFWGAKKLDPAINKNMAKKIALVAALIYAVSPFGVFFDSMALVDSLLSMFGVFVFLFSVLTIVKNRFDLSMITGFFLGGALLTKSPGSFFSLLLPSTWLLAMSKFKTKSELKNFFVYLIKAAFLFAPTYLIAYGMYNILRLGPNFHLISIRNKDYLFPISHLWLNPKDPFIFHLKEIIEWFWAFGPSVLFFLIILGLVVGLKLYKRQTFLILTWILIPLLVSSMYAKVFTARYIFYLVPLVFVVASLFINFKVKYSILPKILLSLFLASSILIDGLLIFDIQSAPLPKNERSGYLEEWTSGYGIKEIADIIKKEYLKDSSKKIVVGTEGYFGTLPDGLQIYLNDYKEIVIIGVGLDLKELPQSLKESRLAGNETYLVINSSRLKKNPDSMGLKLIAAYPKALRKENTKEYNLYGPRETLYLFRVI